MCSCLVVVQGDTKSTRVGDVERLTNFNLFINYVAFNGTAVKETIFGNAAGTAEQLNGVAVYEATGTIVSCGYSDGYVRT